MNCGDARGGEREGVIKGHGQGIQPIQPIDRDLCSISDRDKIISVWYKFVWYWHNTARVNEMDIFTLKHNAYKHTQAEIWN